MSAVENNVAQSQSGQPSLSKQDLSTLDVTKLTALSPEVISRQATINIGTIGHVAHGKSTVVKAVSGVQTVRFKNELERNITIKLDESAAQPCEETEQAPIESSRTCDISQCSESLQSHSLQSCESSQNQSSESYQPQQIISCKSTTSCEAKVTVKDCYIVLKRDPLVENYATTYSEKSRIIKKAGKKRLAEQNPSQSKKKSKVASTVDADEYVVEAILDHMLNNNVHLFLVKWKGWSFAHNTWEPYENLKNCQKVLCRFFDSMTKSKDLTEQVEELRDKLSVVISGYRMSVFMKQFKDENKFLKLPKVDQEDTESLLRGIVNYSIDDPLLVNEVQHQLKLKIVWELRNRQLNKLSDWEYEMNELSKNKGLITVENNFDLDGPPEDFLYINDYIPGENVVISDEPPLGCNCQPICSKSSSNCCGKIWNREFTYGAFNKLRLPKGMPIYECNKRCQCPSDCPNRVVQKGITARLCIFKTNNNCGWGVKALEPIKRGKFVVNYVGEVITFDEAELRGQKYDREGSTYLFDLDFNDKDNALYTVDAGKMGNISHFINHSCDPNLVVHAVWINCLDPNIPHLALFACKDIKTGEELTFDYLCQNQTNTTCDTEANHVKTLCQCGSKNCRSFLF